MTTYLGAATFSLAGFSSMGVGSAPVLAQPERLSEVTADAASFVAVDHLARTAKSHTAAAADDYLQFGSEWFERVLVNPNSFSLGNILSDQAIAVEILPTYRADKQTFTSFVNNAGAGISLSGLTLPYQMELFEDLTATLNVSTVGPANVDSTLDFNFSSETVTTPIDLKRILLFPIPPELPFEERLEWMTDIIQAEDGSEQRIAVREHPRQLFQWSFRITTDEQRRKIENILIDFLGRTFGIPMWHEGMTLSTAVAQGDTVLNLVSTDYTDIRDGGLALIYEDEDTFDVATVTSHTGTTITLASEVSRAYGLDARVYPLRTAVIEGKPQGRQYTVNVLDLDLTWRVTDNVADIASTGSLSTYNGKLVMDQKNVLGKNQKTMKVGYDRDQVEFDPGTGQSYQTPLDRVARHSRTKGLRATGKQGLWELRQLLWAIRGRQVSFYMPTDLPEFTVLQDLAAASDGIQIQENGYAKHVRSEAPYNVIRLTLTDGTEILRTVTAAVDQGNGTESWTVDSNWDSDISVASIAKVDILEQVRFDTDNITIEHLSGGYVKRIGAPVRGVIS